jgi:hypothetical protein
MGGEVFAAPWVKVVHAGEYIFSGSFAATTFLTASKIEEDAPEEKPKPKPRVKKK